MSTAALLTTWMIDDPFGADLGYGARMIRPARPDDLGTLLQLVRDLADYERATGTVRATEDQLGDALFGPAHSVYAHVAEHDDGGRPEIAGFAVWYLTFSTGTATHGIHLQDLYIRPERRSHGYGTGLLAELARICIERGYERFEWSAPYWNDNSIGFYRALGAVPIDDRTVFRLGGEALQRLGSLHQRAPR